MTTGVAIRVPLLAALVLLLNPCQAFLLPSGLNRRPTFTTSGLRPRASSPEHPPRMSVTGFPSEGGKRAWEEDLPTTVGRVAFSSLKDKARDMMVKSAEKRGLDWTGIVEGLQVRQIYVVGEAFGIDVGDVLSQIFCSSYSSPSFSPVYSWF